MSYREIEVSKCGRVGIITLNAPPDNGLSAVMIKEILSQLDEWENDSSVVTVMFRSALDFFSMGGDGDDLLDEMDTADSADTRTYTELGGALTQRVADYPKSTLCAATGYVRGGATVLFNACDIRIAGENLRLKDSDMFYGLLASWGMSSLRLPVWIGRNKIMDYMFLCEELNGRQAYEMGLASRVFPDDMLDESALAIAVKMSKAAPIAVKYFKECVNKAIYHPQFDEVRKFELESADFVYKTEDARKGVRNAISGKFITDDFEGR